MNYAAEHDDDQEESARRQTNVEAITEIMEFSRYGALAQMFIIDTLGRQARTVADAPPEVFEGEGWKNGFVSAQAWQGVAREIAGKLDKHLGK
jgi:hypothetical protein